jgi:hypothetical protein
MARLLRPAGHGHSAGRVRRWPPRNGPCCGACPQFIASHNACMRADRWEVPCCAACPSARRQPLVRTAARRRDGSLCPAHSSAAAAGHREESRRCAAEAQRAGLRGAPVAFVSRTQQRCLKVLLPSICCPPSSTSSAVSGAPQPPLLAAWPAQLPKSIRLASFVRGAAPFCPIQAASLWRQAQLSACCLLGVLSWPRWPGGEVGGPVAFGCCGASGPADCNR